VLAWRVGPIEALEQALQVLLRNPHARVDDLDNRIVIVLASQGFISLEAGITLALGANIGTCVTALLAGLGKPRTALQAATVHVVFNVLGVLLWVFFVDQLAGFVRRISPGAPELDGAARLAAEVPRQIANAHTFFNVANTAIFIWFTGPMAWAVEKLLPERPEVVPERARPVYLDEVYFETPALALDRLKLELVRLGEVVQEMMDKAREAVARGTPGQLAELTSMNDDCTRLYESIVAYSAKLSRLSLSSTSTSVLGGLTSIANTIDNMGDTIATNLVALGNERIAAGIRPSDATSEALRPLVEAVVVAFREAVAAVRDGDVRAAQGVIERKAEIQSLAAGIGAHLAKRVVADEPNRVVAYRIETDAVEILQRLYYFAKRIAKSALDLAQQAEPEREALEARSGSDAAPAP